MKKLLLDACALACSASAFAQGTVLLNNHVSGAVVTHVYAPSAWDQGLGQVGNGSNDFPPGTVNWGGFTPLSGPGFTAQLWAAPGLNQPESTLQPAFPTTTFRTGGGAGFVAAVTVTLPNVPPDSMDGATLVLRVWDNQCGTITSWDQAWARFADLGECPPFNVYQIGGVFTSPPQLVGLQSFSLGGCLGPYFEGWVTYPTSQVVTQGGTATFVAEVLACPRAIYRWYHDGMLIGTDEPCHPYVCTITNAQPSDAGGYWVVASDFDLQWNPIEQASGVATLTVLLQPTVSFQPQSQTAEIGSTVTLGVRASGSPPPAYQWFFNGTIPLTTLTNQDTLLLTGVQPAQSGAYSVVVTNTIGAVTSAPAFLSVVPPVPRRLAPGLSLVGQPGTSVNLEFTDTLSSSPVWARLQSVNLTNSPQWFFDLSAARPPQGFYRAWQTGSPSVRPTLRLDVIPAITLTGTIGSSVRLDYINQFGPVDAWQPVATVTLTNSSQPYFDTSAISQPPRLYRLVRLP
jgi:hypothetical protein